MAGSSCTISAAAGRRLVPTVTLGAISSSSLNLLIGPGVGSGYRIELTNRTGSTFYPFKYEAPVIDEVNLSRKDVSTVGGSTILLKGRNFGPGGLLNCQGIRIGGNFARCTVISPHTLVEVTLPSSAGGKQPIHIFVGELGTFSEQRSELHDGSFLQFPPPEVTSCTQLRSPGDMIRLYGYNFGNDRACSVRFGDNVVPGNVTAHHKEIVCTVPEPVGKQRGSQRSEVQVCVGGQWSTKGVTFEYKVHKVPRSAVTETNGQSAVPSVEEASTIFVQWRLAVRHSALHQEGAAVDVHGNAFTEETVAAAITGYSCLKVLLQDRTRVKKQLYIDMSKAMQAAWAEERLRRGLPETSSRSRASESRKGERAANTSGVGASKRQKR